MAAFDKGPKRRQRRQQTKQQQAPQRQQQLAKTPSKRSGSSDARQILEGLLPKEVRSNQPKQRSTSINIRNWLKKLFGQKTQSSGRKTQKRGQANLVAVSMPPPHPPVTELRPRKNNNPNLRPERNLEFLKSMGRQSPVYPVSSNGRYEFRENGYNSTPRPISSTPRSKPRPKKKPLSPLVYGTRLLILGIGLGVFVGTLLSILDPATHQPSKTIPTAQMPTTGAVISSATPQSPIPSVTITPNSNQEIAPLKTQIAGVSSGNSLFTPGVFVIDLETGNYADVNGNNAIAAASTIKVPILIAFLQDVEAGKIRWDENLTLKSEFRAPGSGNLRQQKTGTQYKASDVVTRMITISDNTAANMAIDRLGGIEALNRRFQEWGLTTTVLHSSLPDVKGTNTSSPKELAMLMSRVMRGELLSAASRDRMIDIMQQTENDNLLPKGIGEGAKIAHKTGNIGSMLADVGMVYLPSGKRYVIAVMVQRPRRDVRAQKIIQQISSTTYQYFSQNSPNPSVNSQIPDPHQPSIQIKTPLPTTSG